MSSENGGESRAAAKQETIVSSDNAAAVGETTNSSLPKKNNLPITENIGKHTKANQKGEELPFYEASNIIYRPGGTFSQFLSHSKNIFPPIFGQYSLIFFINSHDAKQLFISVKN